MARAGVTLTPRRFALNEVLFLIRLQVDAMIRAVLVFLLVCAALAGGQPQTVRARVTVSVVDENGQPVQGAQVTIAEPGLVAAQVWTDYAGNCSYELKQQKPYRIRVDKPGFYEAAESGMDASQSSVRVILAHEQIVREQVYVTASTPGIDTQQVSDQSTMNTPEIVNIPYPTSRDIRNLLPFNPGVVQDATGQVHVAGSETWQTLDTMDGFDIRSPVGGSLSLRVSTDAVRSIDSETTRYPVEFGRATGGVIALYTGMGDDKFRFNATNFIPSFRNVNGIRFDKFVPRFTFSGPLKRGRAWWYDGAEVEYDNIYISELPANANTDELIRGSNLIKVQENVTPANILTAGLLYNNYHSSYDGISSLTPQQSTVKRNTIAWFPYLRDQQSFADGALLDVGIGYVRIHDGYEPHGSSPYEYTPEQTEGSYFENLTGRSQRLEGTAALYLPPRQWLGRHDVKAGLDLDHIAYNQDQTRAPVSYYREGAAPGEIGALDRVSVFVPAPAFAMHNAEIGAYLQDRWQPAKGWLVEPGLRFDWDEIVRRPLVSPRLAAVYSPPGDKNQTKISAGIGLYYEHTQLEYLAQTYAGVRYDTYYAADGTAGPAQQVVGAAGAQRFPAFVNFSPGLEWKFHFRGQYWGLRGVMENAADSGNPVEVNNVVDSPEYGTFSEFQGRAFTARIRLIGAK